MLSCVSFYLPLSLYPSLGVVGSVGQNVLVGETLQTLSNPQALCFSCPRMNQRITELLTFGGTSQCPLVQSLYKTGSSRPGCPGLCPVGG